MIKTLVNAEEALSARLPFALIRSYSSVTLGKAPSFVDLSELLEAWFFSETDAVRIDRVGDELIAFRLSETDKGNFLDGTYAIDNRSLGESVSVRRYISFDEDGQAALSDPVPYAWKGGKTDGL